MESPRQRTGKRLIIAGSRTIPPFALRILEQSIQPDKVAEVVCGDAQGADRLGERWAIQHKIPVVHFPAEWGRFGRRAGVFRNCRMAAYGDCLFALWDGNSHGTHHMITEMRRLSKPVKVVPVG